MKRMKLWIELLCGVGLIFTLGCHSIKLDEPVVKSYQAARKIQYRSRQGADIWQTPKETAASQKGNCVDKAVFLTHLLQKEGYDAKLAFGIVRRASGPAGHAWVVLEDKTILDPTDGWVVQSDNWVYLENRFPVNEFNESYLMARIEKGD